MKDWNGLLFLLLVYHDFFAGTKYYAFHYKRSFFNHYDMEALLFKLENGMLKIRLHLIK